MKALKQHWILMDLARAQAAAHCQTIAALGSCSEACIYPFLQKIVKAACFSFFIWNNQLHQSKNILSIAINLPKGD